MQFSVLVLPAPLGPMRAWIVPGATSKLTPASAVSPPNESWRSSTPRIAPTTLLGYSEGGLAPLPRPPAGHRFAGKAGARTSTQEIFLRHGPSLDRLGRPGRRRGRERPRSDQPPACRRSSCDTEVSPPSRMIVWPVRKLAASDTR